MPKAKPEVAETVTPVKAMPGWEGNCSGCAFPRLVSRILGERWVEIRQSTIQPEGYVKTLDTDSWLSSVKLFMSRFSLYWLYFQESSVDAFHSRHASRVHQSRILTCVFPCFVAEYGSYMKLQNNQTNAIMFSLQIYLWKLFLCVCQTECIRKRSVGFNAIPHARAGEYI